MSERELRDRVEVLYDELKKLRAELEVPESTAFAPERARLDEELAALEQRASHLVLRIPQLQRELREARSAADAAESELGDVRSDIAAREPLGNPLAESRANWEQTTEPGCAVVVLTGVFAALVLWRGLWWL
jgi:chromosome segregation ATPase